jgi:hypothetical protein
MYGWKKFHLALNNNYLLTQKQISSSHRNGTCSRYDITDWKLTEKLFT